MWTDSTTNSKIASSELYDTAIKQNENKSEFRISFLHPILPIGTLLEVEI